MPRVETTTRTLYKFEELTPKIQNKAIDNLCYLNVEHDWWDSIYEDAKNIGVEITEFDFDRGNLIKLKLTKSLNEVVTLILKDHGKECKTYKLALLTQVKMSNVKEENTDAIEEIEIDFTRSLGYEYLSMLRNDFEYLTSREVIIETIKNNDYEFDSNGKLK